MSRGPWAKRQYKRFKGKEMTADQLDRQAALMGMVTPERSRVPGSDRRERRPVTAAKRRYRRK